MKYKYLIFSDAVACDDGYHFFKQLPFQKAEHPYVFNQNGCDCSVSEADVIILEDVDIANNKGKYPISYQIVKELIQRKIPLRVIHHKRTLQSGDHVSDDLFMALSTNPFLQQSHIKGSIFDVELRALQRALTDHDKVRYQQAFDILNARLFNDGELARLDTALFTALYRQDHATFQTIHHERNLYLNTLVKP